ncbi:hypothetical protein T4B_2185 [Trichinella pseudospiralis]|uniref:Uncharacterized protein n=1 Tax=Trichinella pseudospiralis TaxID=6337 RepID=A0A0V1DVA1_TRIPS|nr:hypothetical protein T4A_5589 [Trichinella pseudospiralis]KRZ15444.1 hypothetical protein T4B_2185 [Trichinella pseudospiralis]
MPNLKTIYSTIAGLFGSTVIHEFEDMVIKKSPNFGEQCFAIFRRTADAEDLSQRFLIVCFRILCAGSGPLSYALATATHHF